jgi:aconitate hydratase
MSCWFPRFDVAADLKNCLLFLASYALAVFYEIIYKTCNHASGRRELHPCAELGVVSIPRADSGNGRTRILMCMKCMGVRTTVLAIRRNGVSRV